MVGELRELRHSQFDSERSLRRESTYEGSAERSSVGGATAMGSSVSGGRFLDAAQLGDGGCAGVGVGTSGMGIQTQVAAPQQHRLSLVSNSL